MDSGYLIIFFKNLLLLLAQWICGKAFFISAGFLHTEFMNVKKVWKTVDKSVYNSPDHFKGVHNMVTTHMISTTNPHFTNILTLGLYTGNPQRRKAMDHDQKQPLLPLDERFREAEQYALDLPPPARTPPVLHEEKPCNRLGYCYCPKCNPK